MKYFLILIILFLLNLAGQTQEPKWVNPIIKSYRRILDLENVDVKPDPSLEYKILVELVHDMDNPSAPNFLATNVARLINLHGVGGVKPENLKVAVVIHAKAINSVVNNEAYQERFEVDSPYLTLDEELSAAELIVCRQSLTMFGNQRENVIPQIKVATSALTAISTYQLKDYAYFKWD
ncbi:MAG: intracellular sulfur oxidation DsrE/DsrF family protein [Roseivirga sp.]|jgi:intracellular sulfur oxidation DsrE/DsrF family protein